MGSLLFFIFTLLSFPLIPSSSPPSTAVIKSARLLDLIIRDYTVNLFGHGNFRTGVIHTVRLPTNLSGIIVDTARFRCGSLTRYGVQIMEFHLESGVSINPCIERVILIRQFLSFNWSNMYYKSHKLDGYQLVTPILGLLAYNAGDDGKIGNPFEVGIVTAKNSSIKVNFSNLMRFVHLGITRAGDNSKNKVLYCASFRSGGNVTLTNLVGPDLCQAEGQGHYGLVVEAEEEGSAQMSRQRAAQWKVALGSSLGAALGAFLLGLLLIAMFVKAKKRSKMEEMVRRAYEEEALQVSMVGHVRAPVAPATRTTPVTIEHHYRPPPF